MPRLAPALGLALLLPALLLPAPRARAQAADDAILENALGMWLVWVPPGSFLMGSPEDEPDRSAYEGPIRRVRITRGFWMGAYEVTQREYHAVTGTRPSQHPGNLLPVDAVTWYHAVAFCQTLTRRERQAGSIDETWEYRLPTEAEWEYAARAGSPAPRHGPLEEVAWSGLTSGGRPHPVGQLRPNPWGLYDMLGNVSEWCRDTWADDYRSAPEDGSARERAGAPFRVLRGGSWLGTRDLGLPDEFGAAGWCRVAARQYARPDASNPTYGFRVVLDRVAPRPRRPPRPRPPHRRRRPPRPRR